MTTEALGGFALIGFVLYVVWLCNK